MVGLLLLCYSGLVSYLGQFVFSGAVVVVY